VNVRGAILFATLAMAACTDVGPFQGPGTLQATLSSPNGEEGAAVLLFIGEGVLDVNAVGDTEAYAIASSATTRVVLINHAGGTLSVEVRVADRSRPLVALVQEVAGPDDELRSDLSAYRVELSR